MIHPAVQTPAPFDEEASFLPPFTKVASSAGRFVSLDVFRGITILLMLLVNNIALDAETPMQLMHAPWNGGATLADLVFPWFLLCMGIAIPFSIRSAEKKGVTGWRLGLKVCSRAAGLFLLGLLVDSSIQRHPVFSIGVLQLLALAYLGGFVLSRLPLLWRGIACGLILLGYGLSLQHLTLAGYPKPLIEEQVNLVKFLNDHYLSPIGLRGLPSAIPTAALVALGSILGEFLAFGSGSRAIKLAAVALAGIVCAGGGMWWSAVLPLNKPIWTSSYILFAFGLGSIVIAALSTVFDHEKGKKWGLPFEVFGSNALLAYAGPTLIKVLILQVWTVGSGAGRQTLQDAWLGSLKQEFGNFNGGLAYTLSYIALVWIGLYVCYRKRWFLRL